MHRKRIVLLFLLVLLLAVVSALLFLLPGAPLNKSSRANTSGNIPVGGIVDPEQERKESAFGGYLGGSEGNASEDSGFVNTESPAADKFYEEFSELTNLGEDTEGVWDYTKHLIFTDVKNVDKENRQLVLKVSLPKDTDISGKVLQPVVRCANKESVLAKPLNATFVKDNFDIFDYAEIGDHLYTYCLDKECTEIGNLCVLISRNIE